MSVHKQQDYEIDVISQTKEAMNEMMGKLSLLKTRDSFSEGAFLVFNHLKWIWRCFALIDYLGDIEITKRNGDQGQAAPNRLLYSSI